MTISSLASFLSQDVYRRYLLRQVSAEKFRQYLQVPLPCRGQSLYDTEFVALDFETSGLDAKKDRLLSAGYVVIRNGRIVLKDKGYWLVNPGRAMSAQSVVIHGITDDHALSGESFVKVMEELLLVLAGRVIIVHHAALEKNFINQACRKLYGHNLPMRMIDTMRLAEKSMKHTQQPMTPTSLRLFNLRVQYGLPRYRAHNALEDAIATAELFLAMASRHSGDLRKCKLKEFL